MAIKLYVLLNKVNSREISRKIEKQESLTAGYLSLRPHEQNGFMVMVKSYLYMFYFFYLSSIARDQRGYRLNKRRLKIVRPSRHPSSPK